MTKPVQGLTMTEKEWEDKIDKYLKALPPTPELKVGMNAVGKLTIWLSKDTLNMVDQEFKRNKRNE
jgi:hypothetical protein